MKTKITALCLLLAFGCLDGYEDRDGRLVRVPTEDEMALNNPPNGWELPAGAAYAWSTDIDESTSVTVNGIRSIEFKSTSPASDPFLQQTAENWIPVEPSRVYRAHYVFRATSTGGTNFCKVYVDWLDAAGSLLSSSAALNAAVSVANVWVDRTSTVTAPTGAAFARVRIGKTLGGFTAYFYTVDLTEAIPSWRVYRNAAYSPTPGGAWTLFDFDTTAEAVECSHDGAGTVTLVRPGLYHIDARISFLATTAKQYSVRIAIGSQYFYGADIVSGTGTVSLHFSRDIRIEWSTSTPDTVQLEFLHNDGTRATNIGEAYAEMTGRLVSR